MTLLPFPFSDLQAKTSSILQPHFLRLPFSFPIIQLFVFGVEAHSQHYPCQQLPVLFGEEGSDTISGWIHFGSVLYISQAVNKHRRKSQVSHTQACMCYTKRTHTFNMSDRNRRWNKSFRVLESDLLVFSLSQSQSLELQSLVSCQLFEVTVVSPDSAHSFEWNSVREPCLKTAGRIKDENGGDLSYDHDSQTKRIRKKGKKTKKHDGEWTNGMAMAEI